MLSGAELVAGKDVLGRCRFPQPRYVGHDAAGCGLLQVENVDTILPSATPERLTPPTRVSAY